MHTGAGGAPNGVAQQQGAAASQQKGSEGHRQATPCRVTQAAELVAVDGTSLLDLLVKRIHVSKSRMQDPGDDELLFRIAIEPLGDGEETEVGSPGERPWVRARIEPTDGGAGDNGPWVRTRIAPTDDGAGDNGPWVRATIGPTDDDEGTGMDGAADGSRPWVQVSIQPVDRTSIASVQVLLATDAAHTNGSIKGAGVAQWWRLAALVRAGRSGEGVRS